MNRESRMSRRLFLRASTFAGAGVAIAGGLLPFNEMEADMFLPANLSPSPQSAASSASSAEPKNLGEWIERIFASGEFFPRRYGPIRWEEGGKSYTVLESSRGDKEKQELAS